MKFNLKITVLLCCLLACALGLSAQEENFTVTVKITKPMEGYKAFLYYKNGEIGSGVDSAIYTDGQFELKGKTLHPQRAFLCLAPANKGFEIYKPTMERFTVYLEEGHIIISGADRLKGAKLSGTPLNVDFQGYTDVLVSFIPQLDTLKNKYGMANYKKDTAALMDLTTRFAELENETKKAEERYFLAHLNSPVSLDWLKGNFNLAQNKSKVVELFAKLGNTVKKSTSGKAYGEKLNATQSAEIGSTAPDFIAKNVDDIATSLSSFRGKYVLLDFWASWCAPCRAENPNVLKAYHTYQSKNFTVVGFSMDSSKSSWINAIAKDALPWTQLSSMGETGELAGVLYGINAIPSNFLIDPQGKIIATNLRGEDLEKALAKLFKG